MSYLRGLGRTAKLVRGLDLDFGVGRHAILLAQQGITMYGLDAAANGLAYANAWVEREGVALNLMTGNMMKLPNFTLQRCEDVEHAVDRSGSYHWQIYATLNI